MEYKLVPVPKDLAERTVIEPIIAHDVPVWTLRAPLAGILRRGKFGTEAHTIGTRNVKCISLNKDIPATEELHAMGVSKIVVKATYAARWNDLSITGVASSIISAVANVAVGKSPVHRPISPHGITTYTIE
jgi:hypothetical protein